VGWGAGTLGWPPFPFDPPRVDEGAAVEGVSELIDGDNAG